MVPQKSNGRERAGWLRRLRRVTTDGRYFAEIDGLRFVAIASVMLYHLNTVTLIARGKGAGPLRWGWMERMLFQGERGVLLFFAISGMVLGLPFARQRLMAGPRVPMKQYLLRRVTRLEPPYIANLLLRAPLYLLVKKLTVPQVVMHMAVSLAYMDWLVYREVPAVHGPSWSLAVEVQFYLLAGLIAVPVFHAKAWVRRVGTVAAIVALTGVAAHLPGPEQGTLLKLTVVAFGQYFLVGMLAADLFLTEMPKWPVHWLWDVAWWPACALLFWLRGAWVVYVLPPMMLVLLLGAFRGPVARRVLRVEWIAVLGGMCYSLYLTHSMVLEGMLAVVAPRLTGLGFWRMVAAMAGVFLPMTLVVGVVFFVLVERPCMDRRWPQKLWGRWARS